MRIKDDNIFPRDFHQKHMCSTSTLLLPWWWILAGTLWSFLRSEKEMCTSKAMVNGAIKFTSAAHTMHCLCRSVEKPLLPELKIHNLVIRKITSKPPQNSPCHLWNSAAIAVHPRSILFQQLPLVSWIQKWSCTSKVDPRKLLPEAAGRCRSCPSVQLYTDSLVLLPKL